MTTRPTDYATMRLTTLAITIGLVLLAAGYWGSWISHPVAGLNILGIDLPEYVKFVPDVSSGNIPIKREVFFAPLLSLAAGLIAFATMQRLSLPTWLRALLLALVIPIALAMLPPAWTPALLRTSEFRTQVIYILSLLLAIVISPLLYRFLPDWVRGLAFMFFGVLALQVFPAFRSLLPALESLYAHPLQLGAAFYLILVGAGLLVIGGGILLIISLRTRSIPSRS